MSIGAAEWSAVAASFAALSAFLTMRIHRRNFIESIRPELVLTDWSREPRGEDGRYEAVVFRKVTNVGRGPAFAVLLNCSHEVDNRPTAVLNTTWLPIVAAGEAVELHGDVSLLWQNIPPDDGGFRNLPLEIGLTYSDRRGWRHETTYGLLAIQPTQNLMVVNAVAPGVMLASRTTSARPIWWLRTRSRLARIPLLGRLWSKPKSDR